MKNYFDNLLSCKASKIFENFLTFIGWAMVTSVTNDTIVEANHSRVCKSPSCIPYNTVNTVAAMVDKIVNIHAIITHHQGNIRDFFFFGSEEFVSCSVL